MQCMDALVVMLAQALERAEREQRGGEDAELADLADEADMPLEQLLARYGYVARDATVDEEEAAQDMASPGKQPHA